MDEGNILLAKHLSRHFHKDQKYGERSYVALLNYKVGIND